MGVEVAKNSVSEFKLAIFMAL